VKRVYLAGPPYADEFRRRATVLFRGDTAVHERAIVEGDLADIDGCDAVLAAFTAPDEGTAMEAWYAHARGTPVVVYTGGTPPHPWTTYVARSVHEDLEAAVQALESS
jgi:nucleoside 2-deoxyribosyltransferase